MLELSSNPFITRSLTRACVRRRTSRSRLALISLRILRHVPRPRPQSLGEIGIDCGQMRFRDLPHRHLETRRLPGDVFSMIVLRECQFKRALLVGGRPDDVLLEIG